MTIYTSSIRDAAGAASSSGARIRAPMSPISEHKSIRSMALSPPSRTDRKRRPWEEETAVLELSLSASSTSLYIPCLETISEDPRKRQHRWDEDSILDFSVLSLSTSDLYNPELDPIAENNTLSGTIPSEVGLLESLIKLDLSKSKRIV